MVSGLAVFEITVRPCAARNSCRPVHRSPGVGKFRTAIPNLGSPFTFHPARGGTGSRLTNRGIEPEAHTMNGFENGIGIGLEILPQFGHKHIHTSAQEIIVFSPHVQ